MKIKLFALLLILMMFCASCEDKKNPPVYVDVNEDIDDLDDDEDETLAKSGNEVIVPFKVKDGIKYVPVKINGMGIEMIFDTGCSLTLISLSEAKYLYDTGKLTDEDFLGTANAVIADGSIVPNMVINIKEVVIGDGDTKISCPNVTATVSNTIAGQLLLGNEVLDRVATIKIDNEKQNLIFTLK